MHPLLEDVSNEAFNGMVRSDPYSLATNANSGVLGDHHHQINVSFDTDSSMHLPTSPMLLISDKVNISGSSVMDGTPILERSSNQDLGFLATQNQENQGTSSAMLLPTSQVGQAQLHAGPWGPYHSTQGSSPISLLRKKPRLDIKQEDILQQPAVQPLLQRHDPMRLQIPSPQLLDFIQQQRLRQKQLFFQSLTPMQQVQFLRQLQQPQQQLKHRILQHGLQPASGMHHYGESACKQRLMQYLYHQRQRPTGNTIAYWKRFVNAFYSPCAKKRWCLSLYNNVGQHSQGVAWQCDLCGSSSGRGFESTFEVLSMVYQVKFQGSVIDELFYLDLTCETRLPSGNTMLECAKAVQETVYEQVRVVHEGQLRIIFAPDRKILSWVFCARRHEELVHRRVVAQQVNQLQQVVQKFRSTISERGPGGNVSQSDLQATSEGMVTAACQLFRSFQSPALDEFGLSERYSRFLRMTEVSNSMGGWMDFGTEENAGPVDALNNFPPVTSPKGEVQDMEQVIGPQNLLPGRNTILRKQTAQHPGSCSPTTSDQHSVGWGASAGTAQASLALTNHQNMTGQNVLHSTPNSSCQLEAPSPLSSSGQAPTPGPSGISAGTLQNSPASGFYSGQASQQHFPCGGSGLQQNQDALIQGTHTLQQQLQDGHSKDDGTPVPQHSILQQSQGGNMPRDDPVPESPPTTATGNELGNAVGQDQSSNDIFKDLLVGEFSEPACSYGLGHLPLDISLLSSNEFFSDAALDFSEDDFQQ